MKRSRRTSASSRAGARIRAARPSGVRSLAVRAATRGAGPLERQARSSLRDARISVGRLERGSGRAVAAAAEAMVACLAGGGTVYFCGNGGSAADAQHLATELAGRFFIDRPSLAAIALTTNSSSLTAIGNDFGFDEVFARQLEGLGQPGDVLVAISTSGTSRNVLRAIEAAHLLGMTVIGMTGQGGRRFASLCDHALITPSTSTPRIQEGHIVMGHTVCELTERALFRPRPAAASRPPRGRR
ncbi:MAG TPA: D-sedoheptulose 7-phosphate isomerase [Candidatus Limnocylindria bacterium]|nr:D-sedoheptulose 7-phosphate isomerase [Candidatus Limnocylindria bacterium]